MLSRTALEVDTAKDAPLCVSVQHLQLDDAVCLVFGCGDILLQHLETKTVGIPRHFVFPSAVIHAFTHMCIITRR